MKSYFLFLGVLVLSCTGLYAQQEPQYSQYMYNMSTVNPAYVTNEVGLISTGALYRNQWTGIDGAPETANVFASIPLNDKMELSVNYVNDQIGDAIKLQNHYFNADFAYVAQISSNLKLSFGLKAGLNSFEVDALDSDVADDPAFMDRTSQLDLNLGAGLFLFSHNFYLGLSSPNLLPSDASIGNFGVYQSKSHLYGVAGYIFDVADEIKLKPSFVLKQVLDSPLTFDVSLNALFYNRFELGGSYRYEDSFVALAGFNITDNIKVGYSYDFTTSDLNNYGNGSHEIILLFNFDLLGLSNTYTSPRFY